eukprot:5421743-Prymnesium_polylepis.1
MVQAVQVLKRHALYALALVVVTLFGERPLAVTAALSVIVLCLSLESKNNVWFYIVSALVFTTNNMVELVYARPCEPVNAPLWIIPKAAIHAQWAMDLFCVVSILAGPGSEAKSAEDCV